MVENNNDSSKRYLKKVLHILIFTSIVLAICIGCIIFLLEGCYRAIVLLSFIVLFASNYVNLYLVHKFIVMPIMDEMKAQKLQYSKDVLTGIFRREVFEERRMFYQTECKSLGILFVDVNNLKKINDGYGHYAGDELIIEVANQIKDLRKDFPAVDYFRVGGDEFIIVIKNETEVECRKIAEVLTNKINNICLKTVPEHKVEAAMGLAFSNDKINVSVLLEKADLQMYKMKKSMKM